MLFFRHIHLLAANAFMRFLQNYWKGFKGLKLAAIVVLGLLIRVLWIANCEYRPPVSFEDGRAKNYSLTEYDVINIDAVRISKGIWPRKEDKVYLRDVVDPNGYLISKGTNLLIIPGEPLAWRPIGYPAFLGFLYFIFGVSYKTLYGSTLILQGLTMVVIYLIGKRVFSDGVGFAAAGIFAFWPVAIYSSSLSVDEHLFLPLFLGAVYLLVREVS